jgi:phosphoribosylformylglycinamidine synthase subunit PurL
MVFERLKQWLGAGPPGSPIKSNDAAAPSAATEQAPEGLRARYNLTEEEYGRIVQLIGRRPNEVELNVFSVMWSEHCSYKSSKIHLKKFPTSGDHVLQGPGENAGVVDVGDGWAVALKIESHNHPSFIEPYQGAATGVGGILRDIFTMGARPVALMDSLRMGPLEDPANRRLLDGVVRGIAGYGNCVGVPTVGGELVLQEMHSRNPLVNVLCAGVLRTDRLMRAAAAGPGNAVLYMGSKTGRDGIHGATMASAQFESGDEDKRPNVQVGDPFMEKKLLEACLELIEQGLLVGLQDMGAAGLTSSSVEMAGRAGTGLRLELDHVPLREEGMTPHEICLSESQERMLAVVEPDRLPAVEAVCRKWDVETAVIGEVTATGRWELFWRRMSVASLPIKALTDDAPVYERPMKTPAYVQLLQSLPLEMMPVPGDLTKVLMTMLQSPSLASKAWIYEQYDHMVGTATVVPPGADAAVLRIGHADKAVALSVDGNGRYCLLNPYLGGAIAVMEGARNVTCVGAVPVAVTDCLNFGSPEQPETMWQFAACVEGMADACRRLGLPVVSGNVSLYNETNGQPIYPSPVIGTLGLLDRLDRVVRPWFRGAGDLVLLLGPLGDALGGSEYLRLIHHQERGLLPEVDFDQELAVQQACRALIAAGLVCSAHDCSEGGLAVALAESALGTITPLRPGGLGATVSLPASNHLRIDGVLFGESQSRILISIQEDTLEYARTILASTSATWSVIGRVGGERLTITASQAAGGGSSASAAQVSGRPVIDIELASLHQAWRFGLPRQMGDEPCR